MLSYAERVLNRTLKLEIEIPIGCIYLYKLPCHVFDHPLNSIEVEEIAFVEVQIVEVFRAVIGVGTEVLDLDAVRVN
jgi:hypothetical protein